MGQLKVTFFDVSEDCEQHRFFEISGENFMTRFLFIL